MSVCAGSREPSDSRFALAVHGAARRASWGASGLAKGFARALPSLSSPGQGSPVTPPSKYAPWERSRRGVAWYAVACPRRVRTFRTNRLSLRLAAQTATAATAPRQNQPLVEPSLRACLVRRGRPNGK